MVGSVSAANCQPCEAGFSSLEEGATEAATCKACETGSTSDVGAASCTTVLLICSEGEVERDGDCVECGSHMPQLIAFSLFAVTSFVVMFV